MGVTQWSLWEKENETLSRLVDQNPAFGFLRETEQLYPIRIQNGDEETTLQDLCKNKTGSLILQAAGGMGKTTALLAFALHQNQHYDPAKPVAIYLSAYDYREGEQWFLHDRIL